MGEEMKFSQNACQILNGSSRVVGDCSSVEPTPPDTHYFMSHHSLSYYLAFDE